MTPLIGLHVLVEVGLDSGELANGALSGFHDLLLAIYFESFDLHRRDVTLHGFLFAIVVPNFDFFQIHDGFVF